MGGDRDIGGCAHRFGSLHTISLSHISPQPPPPPPPPRQPKNTYKSTVDSTNTTTTPPISKEIQEIVAHPAVPAEIQIEIGKVEHRVVVSSGETETASSAGSGTMVGPEVSHLGWGRWYTLRELEVATNGLREENVVGEGGYGIVYSGLLADGTRVAVKNLLNNRSYSLMALL
jgi:hypothetical protein